MECTSEFGKDTTSERTRQLKLSILTLGDQMRRSEAVFRFSEPLLLFAESPQDEDRREYCSQGQGKPGSGWDFGECRRQIGRIERCKDEPSKQYQEWIKTPDNQGHESNQARGEKSDENNADPIGVAKRSSLCEQSVKATS